MWKADQDNASVLLSLLERFTYHKTFSKSEEALVKEPIQCGDVNGSAVRESSSQSNLESDVAIQVSTARCKLQ